MFSRLMKVLKIITPFILFGFLILFYDFYQDYKFEQEIESELSSMTEHKNWQWDDKYHRIQTIFNEEAGQTILRKVNKDEKSAVYAYKNADHSLSTVVKFAVKCNPKAEIETTSTYGDGTPKILICSDDGKYLMIGIEWHETQDYNDVIWSENLGGFSVNQDFRHWDFSQLDQELTLALINKE